MQIIKRDERLLAACLLSMVGGFTDVYSYLFRGGVFANAVTGNVVIMGVRLVSDDFIGAWKCLCAMLAYGAGVFAANAIHARFRHVRRVDWHQIVLWTEATLLMAVMGLPCGSADLLAVTLISFVCALQVQTFRRIRGLPFASTMCTGNLRSGAHAFYEWTSGANTESLAHARHYAIVILTFMSGAMLGAVILRAFGAHGFILAPATLLAISLVMHRRLPARVRWLRKRLRTAIRRRT